jgi:hypothetical protein
MASIAISPVSEDTFLHVFSELPGSLKESCEACNGPAAFRWVKQQTKLAPEREKFICRVCASMIVLVGKPV